MTLEIGTQIKQLRLSRGMTQEMLGSELGVTAQAVSKWESGVAAPDIQLLPELAVLFGVSIDELFSMTSERRMERIDNMISYARFLSEKDFAASEKFLLESLKNEAEKPRAVLLLASLYVKRGREYLDRAAPLAREALWLNPNEKAAHNAIFDSEFVPCYDWNEDNRWELIDFYKRFLDAHPDNFSAHLWLLDLLYESGRSQEMRDYLERADRLRHSYRTDFHMGRICRLEGDLEGAFRHWRHMVEENPDEWCAWSLLGDALAYSCRYEEAMECYQKSLEIQPPPRYMDNPVAMAQLAEITGDLAGAIRMREMCIELCRTDWKQTEGEWVDVHRREIQRLQEKMRVQA